MYFTFKDLGTPLEESVRISREIDEKVANVSLNFRSGGMDLDLMQQLFLFVLYCRTNRLSYSLTSGVNHCIVYTEFSEEIYTVICLQKTLLI